ncbi:MAG TPA: ATP-binding cassette domain-containing protein, partial [Rubrobacter sp.]|nr:ATP-binding cassette domain-containing protein [Rubrobacter sp.]
MKALELRGVEKSFKKRRGEVVRALDSISLSVGKGEVVGILGPNGSGKSTLVRVISTLVLPDSGEVEVFGIDATRHPKRVQRSMNRVSVEASFFK